MNHNPHSSPAGGPSAAQPSRIAPQPVRASVSSIKCAARMARVQSPKGLSVRESEVLALVHLRNKDIAQRLGISFFTVKSHLASAKKKLGADSKAHAVMLWAGKAA